MWVDSQISLIRQDIVFFPAMCDWALLSMEYLISLQFNDGSRLQFNGQSWIAH